MRKWIGPIVLAVVIVGLLANVTYQTYLSSLRTEAELRQYSQKQTDGVRMLYMIRIGMLDWMRVCAYESGRRLYSRVEMEKRCSVDLQVEGAGK